MRELDNDGLRLAEFQGKLFEASRTEQDCSSKVFLRRFLYSDLLKKLDKNQSSLVSLDIYEAFEELNAQFGYSDYGRKKYSGEVLFWIGYLYRYISYTRGVSTEFLMKIFPIDKVAFLYTSYHTQDMEWCIRSLLELFGLNEDIFDANRRLYKALKESGYYEWLMERDKKASCHKQEANES